MLTQDMNKANSRREQVIEGIVKGRKTLAMLSPRCDYHFYKRKGDF